MPKRTDIHKVLVIGSGPIVIGQAAEFVICIIGLVIVVAVNMLRKPEDPFGNPKDVGVTYSRPSLFAFSQRAASTSWLNTNCVIP